MTRKDFEEALKKIKSKYVLTISDSYGPSFHHDCGKLEAFEELSKLIKKYLDGGPDDTR